MKIYLQTKDQQQHIKYKKLRAEVRKLTRGIWRDDRDKSVESLECDLIQPQRRGFKIPNKLQLEVTDQIQTLIPKEDLLVHYPKLWFNLDNQDWNEEMTGTIDCEEDIAVEELYCVLEKKHTQKQPWHK
jgi:hypothetical protein